MRDRTEIDDTTYEIIRTQTVAWFLNRDPLHDLFLARQNAQEMMDDTYIRRTAQIQCDVQKDYDDQRDGDWTR